MSNTNIVVKAWTWPLHSSSTSTSTSPSHSAVPQHEPSSSSSSSSLSVTDIRVMNLTELLAIHSSSTNSTTRFNCICFDCIDWNVVRLASLGSFFMATSTAATTTPTVIDIQRRSRGTTTTTAAASSLPPPRPTWKYVVLANCTGDVELAINLCLTLGDMESICLHWDKTYNLDDINMMMLMNLGDDDGNPSSSVATTLTTYNDNSRSSFSNSTVSTGGMPSLHDISGPDSSFSSTYSSSNTTTTTMTTPLMTNLGGGNCNYNHHHHHHGNNANTSVMIPPTTSAIFEAIGNGLTARAIDIHHGSGGSSSSYDGRSCTSTCSNNPKSKLAKLVLSWNGTVTRRNINLLTKGLESWKHHLKVLEIHNFNFSQGSFGALSLCIQKLMMVSSTTNDTTTTATTTTTNTFNSSSDGVRYHHHLKSAMKKNHHEKKNNNRSTNLECFDLRSCNIDDTCGARLLGGLLMNNLRPMTLHISRSQSRGGGSTKTSGNDYYMNDDPDQEYPTSSSPNDGDDDSMKTLLVERLTLMASNASTLSS